MNEIFYCEILNNANYGTLTCGWREPTALRMSLTVEGEMMKERAGTWTSISVLELSNESKVAVIGPLVGERTYGISVSRKIMVKRNNNIMFIGISLHVYVTTKDFVLLTFRVAYRISAYEITSNDSG